MTDDDRPPLDESLTTERAMRTGVPEGVIAFPDRLPDPVDVALDALAGIEALTGTADADEAPTGTTRPLLTITEAAKATDVDRRTIRRKLDAGAFPHAHKADDDTWRIPVGDLLAVGLHLHRPSPPDPAPPSSPPPNVVDELRAEVADWRRRAEVAEALARERAERVDDLRHALLALGAGPVKDDARTTPTADTTTPAPPRRRLFHFRKP